MLLELTIVNFALIQKLNVSFEKGLNILTGETGAGKSILIDSINFVLGEKFNKSLIRTGEDETFVEAVFKIENEKTKKVLKELDIDFDDMVIISRKAAASGKNIAKINGETHILSNIRRVSETLIDIHGQHQNQNLLNASNHIVYLDYFVGKKMQYKLNEYKNLYNKYKEIKNRIEEIIGNNQDRDKLVDFIQFQIKEIDNAKLKIDEDKELEEQFKLLSNYEKINKALYESYEILYNGNNKYFSIFDSLGSVIKNLRNIEESISKIKNICSNLEESYYLIEQSVSDIRDLNDEMYYDEKELEFINQRINVINTLKRKYGESIKDILDFRKNLQNQYDELINSEELIKKLKEEQKNILDKIEISIEELHNLRINYSEKLEKIVEKELSYIGLGKAKFKVEVEQEKQMNSLGKDKVSFLISTNPGEPLYPLEKIVSGGELSRIMLALKTIFVNKESTPSIIFDEIDTGISGKIAVSVADKLYMLSNSHQVFCVTHLPQIACMSDNHYIIKKQVEKGRTYTTLKNLKINEKQDEIARMIGGAEITDITRENSKELINMAEIKKRDLINN